MRIKAESETKITLEAILIPEEIHSILVEEIIRKLGHIPSDVYRHIGREELPNGGLRFYGHVTVSKSILPE